MPWLVSGSRLYYLVIFRGLQHTSALDISIFSHASPNAWGTAAYYELFQEGLLYVSAFTFDIRASSDTAPYIFCAMGARFH